MYGSKSQLRSIFGKRLVLKFSALLCLSSAVFAADKTYDVTSGSQTESTAINNTYTNVVKTGVGELIFSMTGANSFTGYTDVQAGTLTVSTVCGNAAFGSALKIVSGALVTIQQDHVVGWSGKANLEIGGTLNMTDKWIIVNNVSLTSDGAIITGNQRTDGTVPTIRVSGDVTAAGNASYGAYTTGKMLNLRFNSSGSYGSDGDHTISVANGKTLNVYGAIQKEGTGTLILRKKGTGELVLDKTDTSAALLSGTTYIDEGKVTLKGASSKKLTTSNVVASGAVLNMADGGQLDGSALAIAGTFQFSGGTTHTTITLDGDGAKIIGSSSSILFQNISVTQNASITGAQIVPTLAVSNLNVAEGKTLNLSGFQTRNTTNALHLTGKGTVNLTAASSLTAGSTIYVDEGTLKMGGHHLLANVSLNISSKFELGKFWNSNTQNLTFSADGALIQGTWRSASEGEASYGVLRVNGDVTANADSSITDTTLLFYQKGKGALDANGNHNITVAANKTLTINQNLGQNDNSSNEVSLTKLGDGTLQLANLNTRSEAATFAAREFMGGFSINDGTVLASGKFSGAVTLADGAVLSPGTLTNGTMADTAGTLQLASLENNGTLEMDVLNAQTFDVLNVIGTFETSNGNILLNLADDYMPETSDTLQIFTGSLPDAATFILDASSGIDYAYNFATGEVSFRNVAATPEPAGWILLLVGLGFLMRRKHA